MLVITAWILVIYRMVGGAAYHDAQELEELFPWAVHKALSINEQWMGIYMQGKKIGYSHLRTDKHEDGYLIVNQSLMQMQLFGTYQQVRIISKTWTDDRYRLRKFAFWLRSPLSVFQAEGQVAKDKLKIQWRVGKQRVKTNVPYRPAMLSSVLRPYIAAQKPPPGKKIRTLLFDPQTRSYTRTLIIVEEYEDIEIKGQKIKALRLRQHYQGLDLLAWIDEKGEILKESSPGGMMLLRESAQEAPLGIEKGFDMIRATRIELKGSITAPLTRNKLSLHIDNINLRSFPELNRGRQQLQGNVLTILKENLEDLKPLPLAPTTQTSAQDKLSSPKRTQALIATPLIQSDHPQIIDKARKLTAKAPDHLSAILAVHYWVYNSIRKQSVVGIPSAIETLTQRVGDCNEHATLVAALGRAAGIPCEIVTGIAYLNGHFYFHAWNECEISPQQWISFDSTWGQFPSDVTHIVFARGGLEQQLALLQLLGKLKLSIEN
jgi:hypothetical protein